MYKKFYPNFKKVFSKLQCDFQKGFNTKYCILLMIEKWRRSFDVGGHGGYLNKRREKTKINPSNNEFEETVSGVPQGSIMGSLPFILIFELENVDVAS